MLTAHGYLFALNPLSRITLALVVFFALASGACLAEDQAWSGSGDESSWSDEYNWFPTGVPTLGSDAAIDSEGASVICDETFQAKSISIGGNETSQLAVENFINGQIKPSSASDIAVLNRPGGTFSLQGRVGVVKIHGTYEDSEQPASSEPSFMFWTD